VALWPARPTLRSILPGTCAVRAWKTVK